MTRAELVAQLQQLRNVVERLAAENVPPVLYHIDCYRGRLHPEKRLSRDEANERRPTHVDLVPID
ncbi:hypothetical protein U879_10850 [Defluviimonas sp. 20V17]|uniref:Uncharacterized protein n=1 Tax=Allgaiera indica TaxID=765699 RepID=A0AAN4UMW2_9RHOB|nr:hypothetical protein U879_10850 [Defluviimonas sp. 20V17]GHD98472.1 hypothetical protein GCM10008024_02120 [Allgaiera indica]